jgi:hypothetical protein
VGGEEGDLNDASSRIHGHDCTALAQRQLNLSFKITTKQFFEIVISLFLRTSTHRTCSAREGGKEGRREGGREGGREGWREGERQGLGFRV